MAGFDYTGCCICRYHPRLHENNLAVILGCCFERSGKSATRHSGETKELPEFSRSLPRTIYGNRNDNKHILHFQRSDQIFVIGLLQRVTHASVAVDQNFIGKIDRGLLVFIGVEKEDTTTQAQRLLERLLGYRVFQDNDGKMNLGLADINGGLLLVPQFTLPADTRKGMRPSFSSAAPPDKGKEMFEYLLALAKQKYHTVASGQFGADMQVTLTNDGPVTFWLKT